MRLQFAKFLLAAIGIFALLFIGTIFLANAKKQVLYDKAMLELQKSLNAEVNGDLSVSVFKHFPKVSILLADVQIKDANASLDEFAQVDDLTFKIYPWSLISNSFDLSEIDIENGFINVVQDENKNWNLAIFNSSSGKSTQELWKIKDAFLHNVQLRYQAKDKSSTEIVYLVETGKIAGNIKSDHSVVNALLKGKFLKLPPNFKAMEEQTSKINLNLIGKNDFAVVGLKDCKLNVLGNDFLINGFFAEKDSSYVDIKLKGKKIEHLFSLIEGEKLNTLKGFEGNANYDLSIKAKKFKNLARANWKIKAAVTGNRIVNNVIDQKLNNLNVNAIAGIHSSIEDSNFLHVREFQISDRINDLDIDFKMSPFKKARFTTTLNGKANLERFEAYVADSLLTDLGGDIEFNSLFFSGSYEDFDNIKDSKFRLSGSFDLDDIHLTYNKIDYEKINGKLEFKNKDIIASDFMIQFLETDFEFNGKLANLLEYIFNLTQNKGSRGTPLIANGQLRSQQFNLGSVIDGFSPSKPSGKKSEDAVYSVALEQVLNMKGELKTNIASLVFDKMELENLTADLSLDPASIQIKKLDCDGMGGQISSNGNLNVKDKNTITLRLVSKVDAIEIDEMFRQCNNFGQNVLVADHVDGRLTASINFTSSWKNITQFQERELLASADVLIEKGNLRDFEPLSALSKHISLEELENIRFATIKNRIEIKDRAIEIPEMEILSNVIKIEMSGKHNFDNIVDYRFKMNLKSLLAKKFNKKKPRDAIAEPLPEGGLNLFIRMVGDLNDPDISFDKEGRKEKIKEDFKKQKEDLKEIFKEEEKKKPEEIEKSKFKIEKKPEYIIWDDEDSTDAERYR
ncbi:MAG: hypothetical protein HKN92_00195 [Chitinophagales bacterium]|nr:hypothetical protein [Chitinophagales bacterium]